MPLFGKKIPFILEAILASIIIGIIIPLIFSLRAIITNLPVRFLDFLAGFFFTFTVSFCIYFFNVRIVQKIHSNEKYFRSDVRRILLELIITISISALMMAVVLGIFHLLYRIKLQHAGSEFFDNIVIAIIVNVVMVGIFESLFFFRKWKNSLIESEQLRRQNIESQYAALTSQINPHFLFNSLNTLSSLIQSDPAKALNFNREFSKIYRYVLDSKDKLVVSLREEIDFLNSYFKLQKIRFEKSLHYRIEVDASCLDYYLPPLSLQLLVENAIKHNEISEENPLQITISAKGEELVVENNYQPVVKQFAESGIGLKNLTERYSHYTSTLPVFKIENNHYIAVIPLLPDE
jgi:two-component system, LytTR family, sensor kinase